MTRAELIEALETAQGADSIYSTCGMICDAWDMRIESDPAFKRFAIENAEKFSRFLTANAYLDAAMMLATGDNAKFIALSDAMVALEKAGWPNGTWHEHLPRFIAAACLRAGGE